MKKGISKYFTAILFLISILYLASCGGVNENEFRIEGKLSNVKQSFLLFTKELPTDSLIVDTIEISKDGSFSYEGAIDSLTMCFINVEGQPTPVRVFVDRGWNIKVVGDAEYTDLVEVKGGDVNDDITAFKKACRPLLESRTQLAKYDKENSDKDKSAMQTELRNAEFELAKKSKEYIKANPTKILSPVLISRFFKKSASADVLDEQLALLKGPAANFYVTEGLKEYSSYLKRSMIGVNAPNFSLNKLDSSICNLSQYRGKKVLLSFMSATCEFCDAELPHLLSAYETIKKTDPNIVFIAIYVNADIEKIKEETSEFPKEWIVLVDKKEWASEVINLYNITEIPYHVLISAHGKIVDRGLSLKLLPEKIVSIKEEATK